MPRALIQPCDLTEMQATYPCLNCLSETQLMMIMFIALNFIYNYLNDQDISPTDRLKDMGCLNCLSDKQLLQGVVAKILQAAVDAGYQGAQGLEDASCTQCADPKVLKVALAAMLCGITGEQLT